MNNNEKETIFNKLNKVKCEVKKKGQFNYISWAEAWREVKKLYPNANYRVVTYNRPDKGSSIIHPVSKEGGGFVVVEVTIEDLTHQEYYPILNNFNKPIKYDFINAFDVNNAIKRGLAKCIAQFGLGLYVFNGEDLPEK